MSTIPKTFYSLQTVGRILKIPSDTIKDAFRGKELSSIQAIAPIAHLFRKFEEADGFSYAILKSHFDKWQKTGKVPKVSSGRPPRWKNNPDYDNINIPVPKKLYDEFKQVVDNGNALSAVKYSYRDMIYVAMQEFCNRRPNLK